MRRWDERLLAAALVGLGVGVFAGAVIGWAWESPLAPMVATGVVGFAMVAPIIYAFRFSRPVGLLRFRLIDLLWGVGLGVVLRLTQGAIADSGSFPSFGTIDGRVTSTALDIFGMVVAAPVIEELFFRAVIVVALFTTVRRLAGHLAAGIVAALVSTGLFVMTHAVVGEVDASQAIGLALLGFLASGIVLLSGRIWGAILLHAVYNTSFVALSIIGTALR